MIRPSRTTRAFALLALLAAPGVLGQLTSVPDLTTATQLTATSNPIDSASSTGATTGTGTNAQTSSGTTISVTTSGATSTTGSATTTGSSTSIYHLSGVPMIAGAGVPTLVIPYTANAPFMQKSTLPEGTVFIAVGAVLAFLGACVLLWRGLVAWSITRSVKRAAMASIRGSEKTSRNGFYKEFEAGSSMSLDALTSAGRPIKSFRDHDNVSRGSTAPPAGLFFSPTANVQNRSNSPGLDMGGSNSTYLPAGYYASPSASHPAGGAGATTIGGSLAPYARHSTVDTPSPPASPNMRPSSQGTSTYFPTSRDGLRANDGLRSGSRDRLRSQSRDRYSAQTTSFYARPSSSSLAVGLGGNQASTEHLGGSRAPSAYLDDLFDNHGSGPRERY